MKTVKFNPLHPSSAHLQGIHFLLAAKKRLKNEPKPWWYDALRVTHKRYSNYASLTPSTFTFTACNVRLWNNFLQRLHLRVKIQFPRTRLWNAKIFSPEIGNQSVFRGSVFGFQRDAAALFGSPLPSDIDTELATTKSWPIAPFIMNKNRPRLGQEVEYVQLSQWIKTWTRAAAASVFMATSKCLTIKRLLNMIYARMFHINGKVYLNTQHMCFV